MRARAVERMDAARAAEHVLRGVRVERVRGECVGAGGNHERGLGDDQMQETFLRADRAVAIDHIQRFGRIDAKLNRTAVTTSGHAGSYSVTPRWMLLF